jgi:hypothetical protein
VLCLKSAASLDGSNPQTAPARDAPFDFVGVRHQLTVAFCNFKPVQPVRRS